MFSVFSVKPLRVALLCGASLSALHTVPAQAGDTATVTVTATIVNRTCTPDWTDNPDELKVPLGTIDAASADKGDLKTAEFTLGLTNCTDVTSVKVTAKGKAHPDVSTEFDNTVDKGATGFAVHLEGGPDENTRLKPDGSTSVTYPVSDGAASMKFKATLEKVADTTTSGDFSAPITLTMDYD
ncbi:fimbrial protein [Enterobacter asburiae]